MLNIYGCKDCVYSESTSGTEEYSLSEEFGIMVYPNPFAASASIQFTLSAPERVRMELYTLAGVKVSAIIDQSYPAGNHTIQFDGSHLTGGIYLLKTTAGQTANTKKISIMH
jgi:hypothetical protein